MAEYGWPAIGSAKIRRQAQNRWMVVLACESILGCTRSFEVHPGALCMAPSALWEVKPEEHPVSILDSYARMEAF